ncbi:MAG: hypothetical protein ACRD68_11465 [Pyrinomonadaceae bacterium]
MTDTNGTADEYDTHFHCPHCDTHLGETSGRRLRIDSVIFRDVAVLTCSKCLRPYEWHPESPRSESGEERR